MQQDGNNFTTQLPSIPLNTLPPKEQQGLEGETFITCAQLQRGQFQETHVQMESIHGILGKNTKPFPSWEAFGFMYIFK